MLGKLKHLVRLYKNYLLYENEDKDERMFFYPDYQNGCTAYNKPCQFIPSCTSKGDNNALLDIRDDGLGKSDFKQLVYEKESKEKISLNEYRKLLGLDK
jgi:hypothetical protein